MIKAVQRTAVLLIDYDFSRWEFIYWEMLQGLSMTCEKAFLRIRDFKKVFLVIVLYRYDLFTYIFKVSVTN